MVEYIPTKGRRTPDISIIRKQHRMHSPNVNTENEDFILEEIVAKLNQELDFGEPKYDRDSSISARVMYKKLIGRGKPIYWIKSYKTLLKYISRQYKDIFQPVVLGEGTGLRYKVKLKNVAKFIYRAENNMLPSTYHPEQWS